MRCSAIYAGTTSLLLTLAIVSGGLIPDVHDAEAGPNQLNNVGVAPSTTTSFRFGVVSDLDKLSIEYAGSGEHEKKTGNYVAYLREGVLKIGNDPSSPAKYTVTIKWDHSRIHRIHPIKSRLNYDGRGMELSTLNVFNGHLYSCDDRTGVIYELPRTDTLEIVPVPWVILADGNYTGPKGFKCEWATIKNDALLVGGHGTFLIDKKTGAVLNDNSKFVKNVTAKGEVTHLDWYDDFQKMSDALDIHFPGYVTHESAGWSDKLQKWVFMPRKISTEAYNEDEDESTGSNTVLIADEDFSNVQVKHIGKLFPTHGFSSFKFIPGTGDSAILAIKSVEVGDFTESYILAFDLNGNILWPETKFASQKYEGVEFL